VPITGFTRIDTVTVPDKFMSVICVTDGEPADIDDIREKLEVDKSSLDYLGVASDSDPLEFKDLYKIIKDVRPKGLKVLLITDCRDPAVLDDLVGAGYAHAANILVGRTVTDEQKMCMEILRDNGCRYAVTAKASEHDRESLESVAGSCDGCSMFILKQDKAKPVDRSMMSQLTAAAKTCTWNVKVNRSLHESFQRCSEGGLQLTAALVDVSDGNVDLAVEALDDLHILCEQSR